MALVKCGQISLRLKSLNESNVIKTIFSTPKSDHAQLFDQDDHGK